MFKSTPARIVIKEAGLLPAESILNNRQRRYVQRLLTLPTDHEMRKILPETLRDCDAHAQPGEQGHNNWDWLSDKKAKNLGNRLANALGKGTELDTSYGIEYSERLLKQSYPGKITVLTNGEDAKQRAINYVETPQELSIWTDGSKLITNRTGVGVV